MANQPVIDHEAIADNIGRTVDKTALRKVRALVDNFEQDEKAQKARQFRVMCWFLAGLMIVCIGSVEISRHIDGRPLKEQTRAAAAKAKAKCVARSTDRQLAAFERDIRAAQPNIDAAALSARVASVRPTAEDSAKKECR